MTTTAPPVARRHRWRRRLLWATATLVSLCLAVVIAFQVSPTPGALVIRWAFDKSGTSANEGLAALVPAGVSGIQDVAYADEGADTTLDVWFPSSIDGTAETRPTIVWVHGGGWVSGDKSIVANYLKILASHDFTVIGINYSIAPAAQYPTPVRQTNEALGYIKDHATELHADPSSIVLAGDSAGAQIAAQVAAITTDAAYAAEVGVEPHLLATDLIGTVLNCGPYVPAMVKDSSGVGGWFVRTVAWAYIGTKDFDDPIMDQADLVANTTASFPPTWISGGNADPLTDQGRAFADHLSGLGVDVTPLFYDEDHTPALGHEYQFDLSLQDSKDALDDTVAFLRQVSAAADAPPTSP